MNWYKINAKGETATIFVYEMIGEDFFGEGLTARNFAEEVKSLGAVREINLRINSVGGSVFDARAMASILRDHKARIVVDIDGICASAATYLACIGDEVRIAEDGVYMVHSPIGLCMGSAEEMRKEAEALDVIETGMVEIYTRRTGRDEKEVTKLIRDESWLTAQEALDLNFVDSISESKRMAAHVDLSKFPRNKLPFKVPENVQEKIILEQPHLKVVKERLGLQKMKLENAAMRA